MKIIRQEWEPEFLEGLEAIPAHLKQQLLTPTPTWAGFHPERVPTTDSERQLLLMHTCAGGFEQGVHRALSLGADPVQPVLTQIGAAAYEESTMFWWSARPLEGGRRVMCRITHPLECATAGSNSLCIRALLQRTTAEAFAEVFAWMLRQRLNACRLHASLALFDAARGLPAEAKYSNAVLERLRQFECLWEHFGEVGIWAALKTIATRLRNRYEEVEKERNKRNGD